MKQRVLSVALALCLCISSHSVAYAFPEDPAQQEEVLPQATPDGAESGEEVSPLPRKTPTLQEDELPKETPGDAGTDEEAGPSPRKTPTLQEDGLPEETPGDAGTNEEVSPSPSGTPSRQEDEFQEAAPGGEDIGGEESPSPLQSPTPSPELVLLEEVPPGSEMAKFSRSVSYPLTWPAIQDSTIPTSAQVYERMIALQEDERYAEGTPWTNDVPYPDVAGGNYRWNGGTIDGVNIVAVGCVAFAFTLSDAAFGELGPARSYSKGGFTFEDIKVGDILRVNNDAHTVIVLRVGDDGVVIAEGNYNGTIHWGRGMSKEEVMESTSHYITRYPEGYSPDDTEADKVIGKGDFGGGLAWHVTKAGTLTISGQGTMPDFGGTERPWSNFDNQIWKVVIEDGVTNIGSSAFEGSPIASVIIPSSVKTIGDSAFRECKNLSSVNISEGVESVGGNAFRSCAGLKTITLPASLEEVGSAAFWQCEELTSAAFAPGSKQVKVGDNLFTQCYRLQHVTLPQKIDRIGDGMFQNCGMLASVEIPQDAESIGTWAFASCGSLVSVTIPASVTTIGTAAFSNCALKDIYFTGTEGQWNSITKMGDTPTVVSKVTIHYNYIAPSPAPTSVPGVSPVPTSAPGVSPVPTSAPGVSPVPTSVPGVSPAPTNVPGPTSDPDDGENNTGGNKPGNNSGNTSGGNNQGSNSGSNHTGADRDRGYSSASSVINLGIREVMETWKPATPEEKRRYECVGKEAVQYIPSKDNAYQITMENAMQGPKCFQSFEAVLGDYTIGRTYNIYSLSDNIYSMDKEIEITIKIPSAIYKENREYKMICVTKGGQPVVYNDRDNDPETITIKTNKFYAYALIYK